MEEGTEGGKKRGRGVLMEGGNKERWLGERKEWLDGEEGEENTREVRRGGVEIL